MWQTISAKILSLTIVVLLITLGCNALITGSLLSEKYGKAIEYRAIAIGHSLESQLTRLLNLDIPLQNLSGFEHQCREVVEQYEGISYAMVVAPDGSVVFHSAPQYHDQNIGQVTQYLPETATREPWVRLSGAYYEAVIPFYTGSVDFTGTIHIGFPSELVESQVRQLLISSGLAGLAVIAASAVVLVILLKGLVTHPLNNLIGVIQTVRQDGANAMPDQLVARNDELGKLTRAFNELMTELNQSQAEVEGYAYHLEEVVAKRTNELENANWELSAEVKEREKAEQRYRVLFEDAPVMYVITQLRSGEPVITDCNELFFKTLGYRRKEVIGRMLSVFYSPQSRQRLLKGGYERGLKETYRSEERQLIAKGGQVVDTLLQSVPQADPSGKVIGTLAMYSDITDRKAAEKEKKELLTKLQQAKKMEAIGLLAGGVAHDLNNILSGIVSYPQLLLMDLPEDSPLRDPIATIRSSGERAATIVQDLLTLSRRGVMETHPLNLNTIITDFLKTPEFRQIKSYHTNVEIQCSLVDDLLNTMGSPVHLSKVLMNLVSNAAEAMPDGGTLRISTCNRHIDCETIGYEQIREGDYVVMTIADEGIGITLEDQEKIFEPFYSKKMLGRSGTGLGMAVVWGTVKDHEGYIYIQSTIGKGTEFAIYLPATRELQIEQRPMKGPALCLGNGETILLVDDAPVQREIGSKILTRLGYRVQTCASGEEAVKFLQNNDVDLMILDMIMSPEMDGLDTYLKISKFKPFQKTIIASGFSETDRVRQMQELGAGVYIRKPYSIELLGRAAYEAIHGTTLKES